MSAGGLRQEMPGLLQRRPGRQEELAGQQAGGHDTPLRLLRSQGGKREANAESKTVRASTSRAITACQQHQRINRTAGSAWALMPGACQNRLALLSFRSDERTLIA